MSIYLRRKQTPCGQKLTEDDQTQDQQQSQIAAAEAEINRLNQDIVACKNAINMAEQRYQDEKKKQNNIILQKAQRIAELGGKAISIDTKNESIKFKVHKRLNELEQTGKTTELANAIKKTFIELPELSYEMDDMLIFGFARKITAYLNLQKWDGLENHWQDLEDFLRDTIDSMHISLSTKDVDEFILKLHDILETIPMFDWIFGNAEIEYEVNDF